MDFLELAKERYSVRKFSDKKVEKEKLDLNNNLRVFYLLSFKKLFTNNIY